MLRFLCALALLLIPSSDAAAIKRSDDGLALATVVERLSTQLTNVQTLMGAFFKAQGDKIAALEGSNHPGFFFSVPHERSNFI